MINTLFGTFCTSLQEARAKTEEAWRTILEPLGLWKPDVHQAAKELFDAFYSEPTIQLSLFEI